MGNFRLKSWQGTKTIFLSEVISPILSPKKKGKFDYIV